MAQRGSLDYDTSEEVGLFGTIFLNTMEEGTTVAADTLGAGNRLAGNCLT